MTCKSCESLQKLIQLDCVHNLKECPKCGNTKWEPRKEEIKVVKMNQKQFSSYQKPAPKLDEPKQKINQRHYDNLYNKYANDWGIDKTLKWLDKKFKVDYRL